MTNRKSKKFTAFLWHRRIGLAAIVLVVILAITGIMLNHTEDFELDSTYVDSSLLMSWYGLEPETEPLTYTAGDHQITQWGDRLFFDNHSIAKNEQTLKGAIAAEQFIVAAFEKEVLLISFDGELVERIPTSTSFSDTVRLGLKYKRPVIETADRLAYMADEHIIDWDVILNEDIAWSEVDTLDQQQLDELHIAFRGKGLSLERVVLDLHSGRIFGSLGIYVMDAAAIGLLWLSGSGLWVWWSRSRKQKRKRHFQKHHRS